MLRNGVLGMVLLMTFPAGLSGGLMSQQPQFPGSPGHRGTDSDGLPPKMQEQQALARSKERQKKLEDDTAKLLELATDLKTQVDKTNREICPVDVIKKADEIEKLAHSVKERMKG